MCHTMKYTVNRGSQEIGKFELSDIQALMNAGVILPTDYFWFQGMPKMKPVSSLFAQDGSLSSQAATNMEPANRTGNIMPTPTPKEAGPSCPACTSTDVIRAYAAYEKYKLHFSFAATTVHGPRISGAGNSINDAGIKCAPPAKPERLQEIIPERLLSVIFGAGGAGFIVFGLAFFVNKSGQSPYYGIPLVLLGAYGIKVCSSLVATWKQREAELEAIFERMQIRHKIDLQNYARRWRCNKCAGMFQA